MNRQRVYQSRSQSKSSGIEVSGVLQRRGLVRSPSEPKVQGEEQTKHYSGQESPFVKNYQPVPVRSQPRNQVKTIQNYQLKIKTESISSTRNLGAGRGKRFPISKVKLIPSRGIIQISRVFATDYSHLARLSNKLNNSGLIINLLSLSS